ncbi:MAG: hypothetical protein AB2385_00755 [Symbiobacterium sp.]
MAEGAAGLGGAIVGATLGSAAGPLGTAVGAVAGGLGAAAMIDGGQGANQTGNQNQARARNQTGNDQTGGDTSGQNRQ